MNLKSNNFSLSVPQALNLYQIIAYASQANNEAIAARAREMLKAAKMPPDVAPELQPLLEGWTVEDILRAAATMLLSQEKVNVSTVEVV